jgi:hypothetical protein
LINRGTSAGRAGGEELIGEHRRLCQESAKIRADAMHIRMLAAHAFCSVAESNFRWGAPTRARTTLAVVRARIAEIEFHLQEPGHVSMAYADDLSKRLSQLKARIEGIEMSMKAEG